MATLVTQFMDNDKVIYLENQAKYVMTKDGKSVEEILSDLNKNKVDKNEVLKSITPQSIIDKVKEVDGAGSGLDTEFFRGLTPSDFVPSIVPDQRTSDPNSPNLSIGLFKHVNCPNNTEPWYIRTYFYNNLSSNKFQISYSYTGFPRMFIRVYFNSQWSKWEGVLTTADVSAMEQNLSSGKQIIINALQSKIGNKGYTVTTPFQTLADSIIANTVSVGDNTTSNAIKTEIINAINKVAGSSGLNVSHSSTVIANYIAGNMTKKATYDALLADNNTLKSNYNSLNSAYTAFKGGLATTINSKAGSSLSSSSSLAQFQNTVANIATMPKFRQVKDSMYTTQTNNSKTFSTGLSKIHGVYVNPIGAAAFSQGYLKIWESKEISSGASLDTLVSSSSQLAIGYGTYTTTAYANVNGSSCTVSASVGLVNTHGASSSASSNISVIFVGE